MSVIRNAAEGVTTSKTAVHLAWLLVLLLVQTGNVLAGGGYGTSGP
jgi:hypothetical protein